MSNILDIALDEETLLRFYRDMIATRYSEEVLAKDVASQDTKNCIGTAYLARGQEAHSVGMAHALEEGDILWPSHRDMGARLVKGAPIKRAALRRYLNYFGKSTSPTRGVDGSSHDHDYERNIGTFISHMGSASGVAVGSALVLLLEKKDNVAVVSFGEGASTAGRVHEAMNLSGTLQFFKESQRKKLPVIFCVYNNMWAESVPLEDEVAGSLKDRFESYGFSPVDEVDGNDVLAVYTSVRLARKRASEKKEPCAVIFHTFRVGPHGQHESKYKYVPEEDIKRWEQPDRDPVIRFHDHLVEKGILTEDLEAKTDQEVKKEVDEAYAEAIDAPDAQWDESYEKVFADSDADLVQETDESSINFLEEPVTYQEAFLETLIQSMERDPKIVVFGEDIGWRMGGVHGELKTKNKKYVDDGKTFKSLEEIFGHERVFDTSISEEGITAMGVGMAWHGWRPIVWMQFADFVTTAMSSVQDYAARMYWRTGRPLPLVIIMVYGAGTLSGPFHSQDNSAWFCHMPGLKVVCPATPYDVSGLLRTALCDQNPIMFYLHKTLYRSVNGLWTNDEYFVPFGKAKAYNENQDSNFTLIAWGAMLRQALKATEELKPHGIRAEVIDPRTLVPLDFEAILKSFRKTNYALIVHEAPERGGFGAEIVRQLVTRAPDSIGGIEVLGGKNTPVPHAPGLESAYLPNSDKIVKAVLKLWRET